jgi:Domain of unknown function (DUF4190)
MKKLLLVLALISIFSGYQHNVVAQTTENQELTQIQENTSNIPKIASEAATFEPQISNIEKTTTIVSNTETRSFAAKKLTFKQKLVNRFITKKLGKSQTNNPKAEGTHPLALVSGIAGVTSIVLSVIALVFSSSLLSLAFVAFFVGIAAVVTGFIGKSRIKAGHGEGKGLATIGIITGMISAAFWVIISILAIAALSSFGN